jgi:hypothetical protein
MCTSRLFQESEAICNQKKKNKKKRRKKWKESTLRCIPEFAAGPGTWDAANERGGIALEI